MGVHCWRRFELRMFEVNYPHKGMLITYFPAKIPWRTAIRNSWSISCFKLEELRWRVMDDNWGNQWASQHLRTYYLENLVEGTRVIVQVLCRYEHSDDHWDRKECPSCETKWWVYRSLIYSWIARLESARKVHVEVSGLISFRHCGRITCLRNAIHVQESHRVSIRRFESTWWSLLNRRRALRNKSNSMPHNSLQTTRIFLLKF